MPLYRWSGVNMTGDWCRGVQRAGSVGMLQRNLYKKEVGLVSADVVLYVSFVRSIRVQDVIQFFQKMHVLLRAGVAIDRALEVVMEHMRHGSFKRVVRDMIYDIGQGIILPESMKAYAYAFSPLILYLIAVGDQLGDMAETLNNIYVYMQQRAQFYQQIRNVLLLPMMTAVFFIVVLFIIVLYVVPTFARMFYHSGQVLPYSTQILVALSDWLWSITLYDIVIWSCLLSVVGYVVYMFVPVRDWRSRCVLRIPYINTLVMWIDTHVFLHALSLLLRAGIDMREGIAIARSAMSNVVLHKQLLSIENQVTGGASLSEAMAIQRYALFSQEIIALIEVGQETGNISQALDDVVLIYKRCIDKRLLDITTILQPLLMIVLGLCVAGIIFSVYVPIFNMSYVVR